MRNKSAFESSANSRASKRAPYRNRICFPVHLEQPAQFCPGYRQHQPKSASTIVRNRQAMFIGGIIGAMTRLVHAPWPLVLMLSVQSEQIVVLALFTMCLEQSGR
ncbi:MAG: hypothetical protein DMG41_29960 [Acidobacteria bacterium]|nr:MAG: hypothetical protein AUH13_04225 [Acidobacteria bacterium 13_2_20CM_58_27]PYT83771.1 MAG: hypothetical protein DMG41_29960 [Acidobacteriota bacterium]